MVGGGAGYWWRSATERVMKKITNGLDNLKGKQPRDLLFARNMGSNSAEHGGERFWREIDRSKFPSYQNIQVGERNRCTAKRQKYSKIDKSNA